MPVSGQVYQPTTVSYETRPSLLSQTAASVSSPLKILKKPYAQIILIFFALFSIAAGITMIVSGVTKHERTIPEEENIRTEFEIVIDTGLIIGGIILILIGFICFGLYIKVIGCTRNCLFPCVLYKKQGLARQFQQGANGGPIHALNPSTDPLVSHHTQYAPVSELPRPEDEECRTLMTDNKDCLSSAEESDRMLDPDPRIVLRPIGHHHDDA